MTPLVNTRILMRYENLRSFTFRGNHLGATSQELLDVAEAINMLQTAPTTEIIQIQDFMLGS